MSYDIFIDESGLFIETSTDPADRVKHHKQDRKFASQLAGVVCPTAQLTGTVARAMLEKSLKSAGLAFEHEFHSTQLRGRSQAGFNQFVELLVTELRTGDFQTVRIVNSERVSFGDRVANYTNILAELLVRVCQRLSGFNRGEAISLNVYAAKVRGDEDESGVFEIMAQSEYQERIRERLTLAAMAGGWGEQVPKWSIRSFQLASGKDDPRLWIADAISNASHDNYHAISPAAAQSLQSAFGDFDFTLSFNQSLERVKDLVDQQQYAAAVIEIGEHELSEWTSQSASSEYMKQLNRLIPKLFELAPAIGVPQLQAILGWLRQLSENRERLDDARQACNWFETQVLDQVGQRFTEINLDAGLENWLRLGMATASLTACNHGGDVDDGKKQATKIDELVPKLAGRWEFTSDLMQSLITQAVHFNDLFKHSLVVKKMSMVAEYYQTLGSLFHEVYPGVFPQDVRSDLCGAALGTKVQAETYLMLSGKLNIETVRQTSDAAIAQFAKAQDLQRQYQYRSEIEAIGENWDAARHFLSEGIGCAESDHESLGTFIQNLSETELAFALLHWTRLGGVAATSGTTQELDVFFAAWCGTGFDKPGGELGQISVYPVHGILRRLAAVYAAKQDLAKTTELLRSLRRIVENDEKALFQLIEAAAVMGAVGIIGRSDLPKAIGRLKGSKNDPSLSSLLHSLVKKSTDTQPIIAGIGNHWLELTERFESGKAEPNELIIASNRVGY